MLKRAIVLVVVVASASLGASSQAPRDKRAMPPCGSDASQTSPRRESTDQGVGPTSATSGRARHAHAYYESLVARPDCAAAYSLRSDAELATLNTVNKGSPKKRPLVYDPVIDAAKLTIHAPTSTDIKGKHLPVRLSSGTMLLTWDFRFSEEFRWKDGYAGRHKTWRLLPGYWIQIRTDYRHAARQGKFAEMMITVPGKKFLGPGSRLGAPSWFGETLQPQRATFYYDADTWTRVWLFVEGLDRDVCYLSVWAADEKQDPIQLYDRVALIPPKGGLTQFHIEYDTSRDQAKNPKEMYSWNRNVVVLHNIPRAEVAALLKRPAS